MLWTVPLIIIWYLIYEYEYEFISPFHYFSAFSFSRLYKSFLHVVDFFHGIASLKIFLFYIQWFIFGVWVYKW